MMQIDKEFFERQYFKEILETYENSVKSGQPVFMATEDLTDIADYYSSIGEQEKAMRVVDYALEQNPGATLPLVFKTREALKRNDIAQAQKFAEDILDKEDPDYRYLTAEIMIAQHEIEEADMYLEEYSETIDEDEWEDYILDVCNLYIDYKIYSKALKWLMRNPDCDNTEHKDFLAQALFGLERYSDCISVLNNLIDEDPYDNDYWSMLAKSQLMLKDYSGCITSCEYAIAIDPSDSYCIFLKATGLYKLGNYKEALKYHKKYSEINPYDENGELNQAICLTCLGKYEEAIAHLRKAETMGITDAQTAIRIYEEMAFAYNAIKRPDEAIRIINQAEDEIQDSTDSNLEILRGHIMLEQGDYKNAENIFKKAVSSAANPTSTILHIMVSLCDNGYAETAYRILKKLYPTSDDKFKDGFSYMAMCCWETKRYNEFMNYLKAAVKQNPQEAKLILGDIFPPEMEPDDFYSYIYNKLKQ